MPNRLLRGLLAAVAGSSAIAFAASGLAYGVPGTPRATGSTNGDRCLRAAHATPTSRQHTFAAAGDSYGVPRAVLLGVSYLESRWDNHGDHPSTAGGYGPMHLTDVPLSELLAARAAKGDPTALLPSAVPAGLRTIDRASAVTGFSVHELKTDLAANICGGAALLASYQRQLRHSTGAATSVNAWVGAVRRYSATRSGAAAEQFARRVYTVIHDGTSRTTNDGQRVTLTAHPDARVPALAATSQKQTDCPANLACTWVPAPYVWYDHARPSYYGNHDLAHRPTDLKIDYIVIHDSQTTYANDLRLVQDPAYVSWNYTVRSSDGHVAQHLHPSDVGWHAGNWYVNMHSIGIEHEGYAATGATWYTESMYQSSADLVRHLAAEFGIPLDRAHIIGHDQVPGIKKGYTAGMHWDPGPYWNWQHYMALLGAPLRPTRPAGSGSGGSGGSRGPGVVTVAPGFTGNQQLVTGCDGQVADACPRQGANFVYLHTRPDLAAPLVPDSGLHPDGAPSTRSIADWGARADAGQKLVVARRQGAWLGTWWGGRLAWIYSPPSHPVVLRSRGATVSVKPGAGPAPVYGRAFPERAAYAAYRIRYQPVAPLEYTIKPGQRYVLADQTIPTDYYYTRTYHCQHAVDDCTDVVGRDRYYEIWFNHRIAYVRAADVSTAPPQ